MDGARRAGARSTRRRAAPLLSAAAAAALLLGACDDDETGSPTSTSAPPEAGLRVEVTPAEATPDATVEARVVNGTADTFTYGLAYALERRQGSSFVKVAEPRVVPSIGLVAKPGDTGPPVRVRIPRDARPGEYRVVIQRDVPDVGVLSGELAVTADR